LKNITVQKTDNINYCKVKDFVSFYPKRTVDYFEIEITLVSYCNFKCSYCKFNVKRNKRIKTKLIDLDVLKKFVDTIKQKTRFNKVKFYVFGGEPTVHPDFVQFMHNMSKTFKDDLIEVQTNLKRTDKLEQLLHLTNVNIRPSYHFAMQPYEEYLQNLLKLKSRITCMNFMYEPAHKEELRKIFALWKKVFKFEIILMPIRPLYSNYLQSPNASLYKEYESFQNEEDVKVLAKDFECRNDFVLETKDSTEDVSFFDIFSNKLDSFKGYYCHVFTEKISIDANGDLHGCFSNQVFQNHGVVEESSTVKAENMYYILDFGDYIDRNFKVKQCIYEKCFCDFFHYRGINDSSNKNY